MGDGNNLHYSSMYFIVFVFLKNSMNFGSIVAMDWHTTAEGETILQHFYNPQTSGRKIFGVLERPAVPPTVEEVSYKIFFTGPSGVGKTASICRLAGTKCPSTYCETLGIQKTNVYWPVKIWDKIILFKLQLWDAGDSSTRKYSHVSATCENKSDAVMMVFAYTDRASFMDMRSGLNRHVTAPNKPAIIALGTRCASNNLEVSQADVKEFEVKHRIPVLQIENRWSIDRSEVHEVAPLLNMICEKLWARDQEYLLRQSLAR